MTTTQTVEAIEDHLDECPADWAARQELADLFEEAGDQEQARLQRWLARHWKAPDPITDDSITDWRWYATAPGWPGSLAVVGDRLFALLPTMGREWGFSSRREAEQGLLVALQVSGWPAI